jgi:cytochrome c553
MLLLSACGNDTENTENIEQQTNNQKYNGPSPATADIQNFKREFWAKLNDAENCGGCHDLGGTGATKFVRTDNVNQAYFEALTLLDLTNVPNSLANSSVVTKVANGHNCWLATDQDCAAAIISYIQAWQLTLDDSPAQIKLVAPVINTVGASKNFPAGAQDNAPNSFAQTVYPLLTTHCSSCHAETAATPQAPFFANESNADAAAALAALASAYDAAKAKLDLDKPENSRLVVRLTEEFHNCWSADCQADAQAMADKIRLFADNIALKAIDSSLIISKAMRLGDAIIASSGIRHEDDVIALYEFKAGSGNTAFDSSGVAPLLPLTLNGSVSWVLGFGIEILTGGKAQGSVANSKKLSDFIKASGEYAIEAWVAPTNIVQNGSSIITYSGGGNTRNFTMGQSQYNYDFLNRNNVAGLTTLSTADGDEDLQATLQHVVMNFSPVAGRPSLGTPALGRSIYVNGVFTGSMDTVADQYMDDVDDPLSLDTGGLLTSWNDTYALALGNEPGGGGDTLWKGKIRLLAIHSRALTRAQILQNLQVGVGQKYFMLFSIADRIAVPDSYILFQLEQFDNQAYLFHKPTFVNLNSNYTPASPIIIKGLRIGINSRQAIAGQAFANLNAVVDGSNYVAGVGHILSTSGTIISAEKGPAADEFFLSFEQLGSATNARVEPVPAARVYPSDPVENISADIGVRTFDEINTSMAKLTQVAQAFAVNIDAAPYATVKSGAAPISGLTHQQQLNYTFSTYRQQLPAVENINTFLASHQMAIAQMAMRYCSVLVDQDALFSPADAQRFFAGFVFSDTASTAFNSALKKKQIFDALLVPLMNIDLANAANNLLTQPDAAEIRNTLGADTPLDLDASLTGDTYSSLLTSMTQCLPACDTAARTQEIVKAMCTATLGSAIMLLQ